MTKNSDWIFTSYEKIAEAPEQWQLDEAGYRLLDKLSWVVTEKIHGANFCFLSDGTSILCANRKQILHPGENFFQHVQLLARLKDAILHIWTLTREHYPDCERIFLYGELFGGAYPHPEVAPDPSVQAVQTGIYYSPHIEFCAFDLAIESPTQPHHYLDYDQACQIFKAAHLLYAMPLFIGSYRDALAYSPRFPSTIPALLGLPALPENTAEGIVIKPVKSILLPTRKKEIRPILKKKIAEFSEEKRFSEAQKWSRPQTNQATDRLALTQWEAFNLITENRLQNAISKVGLPERGEKKRAQQIFRLLVEDVLEQLVLNQEELFSALTAEEKEALTMAIHGEVRVLMSSYFKARRGSSASSH